MNLYSLPTKIFRNDRKGCVHVYFNINIRMLAVMKENFSNQKFWGSLEIIRGDSIKENIDLKKIQEKNIHYEIWEQLWCALSLKNVDMGSRGINYFFNIFILTWATHQTPEALTPVLGQGSLGQRKWIADRFHCLHILFLNHNHW